MVNMIKTPMADLQKTAKLSLAKHGVEADGKGGVKVRLVLDHSGSMGPWYAAGAVQRLTEQVLGLASALDDDGTIEVWYFGSGVSEMYTLSLNPTVTQPTPAAPAPKRGLFGRRASVPAVQGIDPYYVGWVDRTHTREPWGTTNYVAGMSAPIAFQKAEQETEPALVIFQTDGGPDSRAAASRKLQEVSGENTFFAFVVFGPDSDDPDDGSAASYMHSLNSLDGRVRDNASAYIAGDLNTFAQVPDSVVYDGVLGEFVGQWLPQVL